MPRQPRGPRKKVTLNRAEAVRHFGRRVRELRLSQGMKQASLARKAEFSLSYITRLEKGEAEPGLGLVVKIAAALGVPTHELLPEVSADPWPGMEAEARKRLEAILARKDQDALQALLPILALAEESSARRRK